MPLIDSLNSFRGSVTDADNNMNIALLRYRNGRHKYNLPFREFVVESSFLKIFIAWETFLESVFIKYMMGENPIINPPPTRYVNPIDPAHANNMLIGTKSFADWSKPDDVRKLSELFFGHAISLIPQFLQYTVT